MTSNNQTLATPEDDAPYVCPGCYAVGDQACASWCIDDEIAREHADALERGDFSRDDDGEPDEEPCIFCNDGGALDPVEYPACAACGARA